MQIRSLMVPTGMLGVVLVALVTTVVFVFTTFIILTVRNVLIVLTIIVSPLAFAAMILPGTNNLFEKWRKLFMGLLILFPALMALLYGGVLVGQIILRTYDPKADIFTRLFIIILVLFVSNIGVVGARALFELIVKFLGSAGRYFGRFNDPNKGPIDRARKKSDEMYNRGKFNRNREARKAERFARRDRNFARSMSAQMSDGKGLGDKARGLRGMAYRRMYGGGTLGFGKDARESQANIYDAYRENIGKTTERTRGRLTDAGLFTAGTKYGIAGLGEVDKDTFMEQVYIHGKKGTATSLDGTTTKVDGSDSFTNSAIASQAAKSGDKAMFGKLLTSAMTSGNKDLEFTLRDFGINNAQVVSGGHPDVVKGSYAAYKAVTPEALLSMDGSAVKRMGTYLSDITKIKDDLRLGIAQSTGLTGTALDAAVTKKATEYQKTAYDALQRSVTDINTKSIYAGKAAVGGDLDKAVIEAAETMGLNPKGSSKGTATPIIHFT